ncbi:glycoside hydrolase family 13 protein [Calocera cornea HHB12733]|uniref:Glycoside hydrolase family 13 protein n=1 Tax=Calocera cornea HHB12733 TaxID=1353952 RepID=A0A165GLT5_9BASI|nr:glycoside hydrolase family 13 protein [Calocera cornea HHB12733]
MATETLPKWWKEATVYQIYPASFKDSNGDGLGDIPGISSKLDYIKTLGVNVLWICPFYKSPQYDMGYDISDYQDVHAPYGTKADIDALIQGTHERGMKIIFDLVVNHTSHEHAWFKESRSSRDSPKRDWYMWRPGKVVDGKRVPPNNWRSNFGGSVWEWDEPTQEVRVPRLFAPACIGADAYQYYLHYFAVQQPDLNWENPVVRKAVYATAVNFWLDKGVDGFRIDTVNMYSKYLDFPDAEVVDPSTPWQPADKYYSNGPRLHEFLKEMHRECFSKYDVVSIGECPNTPDWKDVLPFVSTREKELDMVIQFDLASMDHGGGELRLWHRDWKLHLFKAITEDAQMLAIPEHNAWCTTYLENHDQARSVSRFGSDEPAFRVQSAKMLATYLLTLSGTPIIYQGEELGMVNMPPSWDVDTEYKDLNTIDYMQELRRIAGDDKDKLAQGIRGAQLTARDHSRTPMQWDGSANAGFSTAKQTWMRVNDSYREINAAAQEGDGGSVLAYYRALLKLRHAYKQLFVYGQFELCDIDNKDTMTFIKRSGAEYALVLLNFTKEDQPFVVPSHFKGQPELLISNVPEAGKHVLRPFEARIYVNQGAKPSANGA